jgi:hypothetical protein
LGYDGKTWEENLADIEQRRLPTCGANGSAAAAERRAPVMAVLDNAQSVHHAGRAARRHQAFEHIATDEMVTSASTCFAPTNCRWRASSFRSSSGPTTIRRAQRSRSREVWDDRGHEHRLHLRLSWFYGAGEEYAEAVAALMDTDALIIDPALQPGGIPHASDGHSLLFGADVDLIMRFVPRDDEGETIYDLQLDPGVGDIVSIDADEATFYDSRSPC